MSSFRYLKRSCPICQGARTDCRQSDRTQAVHCRAPEVHPAGWEATGIDIQGFTIWIESAQATRPDYWADLERQRQQRQQQQTEERKRLLPPTARNRQWRIVAGQSGLATRHRAALAARLEAAELSPAWIDRLVKQRLLFTWQPHQTFPGVTPALPGTDKRGRLRTFTGWAIGIPDPHGHVLGVQIKPEHGAGYFWAASEKPGPSIHLPNGEAPIGVYRPSVVQRTDQLGLAEGFLKSAIAAERLGIPFIGAAGGHFASSPEQFQAAVEALSGEGPIELVLYPDAGMFDNKHANVHSSWRRLADLCDRAGYTLRVAWWGQTEKAHGDVDEAPIATLAAARLISMAELEALLKEAQQDDWRTQYEQLAKAAWERCRRYTPTHTTEQRYVSVEAGDLLGADIHALKSEMGTGKTQALATLLGQSDLGAIAIGSRNSLLLQSCERWGHFYHLHQDSAHGLIADPQARIACCVDSLQHFADSDFDGKIIILDESLSIVKHALLSSTLKGRRDKALQKFEQAIKHAAVVIAWDGNNADIAINYLAALRGEHCRVVKALNAYRGDRLEVELIRVCAETGNVWASNHTPVINKLGESLRAYQHLPSGARAVAVTSDSQRLCEALDLTYSEQGFKVLRIDSKTITDPAIKRFLANPDAYIAEYQPDLLVMSPSAESGLDISIPDTFAKGFAFFFGVIDTASQLQFLRRVRRCLDWTAWCVEYTVSDDMEGLNSPFARQLSRQLMEYLQADAIAALKGHAQPSQTEAFIARLQEQAASPHHQTTLQFMAARNYERLHTRQCLQETLVAAGHHVTLVDVGKPEDSTDADAIREARAQIIEADSRAIYAARDISPDQAARIKASFSASIEDRWAAEKAFLKSRLPRIEYSIVWSWEFIAEVLFKDRGLIKRLERWWMLNHLETAQRRARDAWESVMAHGAHLSDIRSDYRLLQAFDHLSIVQLCDGQYRDARDPLVQTIYQKCRRSKPLQAALGRKPGKLSPLDWVGRLCRIVGITSQGEAKPHGQRGGEGSDRWYRHQPPETDPYSCVILECLSRSYDQYGQPETAERLIDPATEVDHLLLNENLLTGQGDPGQPLALSAFERDRLSVEAIADIRAMIAEATAQGPAVLKALQAVFDPAVWRLATG